MSRSGLRVVAPGLLTTVQDAGRFGLQRLGVPTSGVADPEAMRAANALVGNADDEAVLEVTARGPVVEAIGGEVLLGVAGGPGPWQAVAVRPGERLDIGSVADVLRCCVAVAGGIDVARILGSRSTYMAARIGPFGGRALRGGDVIGVRRQAGDGVRPPLRVVRPPAWWTWPGAEAILRAVPGPDDGLLTAAGRTVLFGGRFVVSPRSDRVGVRLDGPWVERTERALQSSGCAAGTVQLPPAGPPIVLGPDRGTTGGYPRVATLASVDLPLLGRLRPGQAVRFETVTVGGAERLRCEREGLLEAWLGQVREG